MELYLIWTGEFTCECCYENVAVLAKTVISRRGLAPNKVH